MADSVITLVLKLRDETKSALAAFRKELDAFKVGTQAIGEIGPAAQSSVKQVDALSGSMIGLNKAASGARKPLEDAGKGVKSFNTDGLKLVPTLDHMTTSLGATAFEAKPLADALKGAEVGARGLIPAAGGAGSALRGATGSFRDAASGLESLVFGLKAAAAGFLGLQAIQTLKGFADTAARAEVLNTVLKVVAVNAGVSEGAIGELDKQVQALGITAESSRTALTAFLQAGLDTSKAVPLARAAQDLAVLAGENSSVVFQRVITNVQQLDTMGLRYNGIVVNMEEATAAFAKTLGKTAGDLSQAERQQALLNAVLAKGAELTGVYEKSMGDVGKQLTSISRLQNDAAKSLGENLLPAYLVIVEEFSNFLKQSKLVADEFGAQGDGARSLAEALRPVAVALREIAVAVVENIKVISTLIGLYLGLKAGQLALGALIGGWSALKDVFLLLVGLPGRISAGFLLLVSTGGALINTLRALTAASLAFAATNPVLIAIVALVGAFGLAVKGFSAYRNSLKETEKTQKLLANGAEGLKAALSDAYTAQIELVPKITEAERELLAAQREGNKDTIAAAKEKLSLLKEQRKENEKEIANLSKLAKGNKAVFDASAATAEANKAKRAVEAEIKVVTKSLADMGLASANAFAGLNISKSFEEDLGNVNKQIDGFRKNLQDENGLAIVSIGQVTVAVRKLVDQAQTFDEIGAAVDLLRSKFDRGATVTALIDTGEFNKAKAAIDEVDKALGGYIGRTAQLKQNQELLRTINTEISNFSNGLAQSFAELGGVLTVSSKGLVEFSQGLQSIAQNRANLNNLENQAATSVVSAAVQRYKAEEQAILALDTKRREIANDQVNKNRDFNAILLSIDRQTNQARLENTKQLYEALKGQQEVYAARVKDSLAKIRDFERAINESRRSEQAALFEIQTSGLNEQARRQATLDRIATLDLQARVALQKEDFETAKAANEERLRLVSSVAGSAKSELERLDAANLTRDAYKQQRDILESQKRIESDKLKSNVDALNTLTAAISKLETTFQGLAGTKTVDIKPIMDPANIRALRDQLEAGLKDLKVTLSLSAGSVSGFAGGGKIRGPGTGTSDSVLIRASNGEFMMRKAAVQHYGEGFMERLNRLSLPTRPPGFAAGGLIGDSAAAGGDTVAIDFSIGGKSIGRVQGSRETMRNLERAAKDMQRGLV